mgnify:CR=1 FL=1
MDWDGLGIVWRWTGMDWGQCGDGLGWTGDSVEMDWDGLGTVWDGVNGRSEDVVVDDLGLDDWILLSL